MAVSPSSVAIDDTIIKEVEKTIDECLSNPAWCRDNLVGTIARGSYKIYDRGSIALTAYERTDLEEMYRSAGWKHVVMTDEIKGWQITVYNYVPEPKQTTTYFPDDH